jgi:hypothetical protein
MTTTTTTAPSSGLPGRWLPALSLLVAGGAAALGVVAITTDDVSDQPAQIVVDAPTPVAADVVEPATVRDGAAPVPCRGQARLEVPCFE